MTDLEELLDGKQELIITNDSVKSLVVLPEGGTFNTFQFATYSDPVLFVAAIATLKEAGYEVSWVDDTYNAKVVIGGSAWKLTVSISRHDLPALRDTEVTTTQPETFQEMLERELSSDGLAEAASPTIEDLVDAITESQCDDGLAEAST